MITPQVNLEKETFYLETVSTIFINLDIDIPDVSLKKSIPYQTCEFDIRNTVIAYFDSSIWFELSVYDSSDYPFESR